MKAQSILKFLTAVMFLLTAQFASAQEYADKEDCEAKCTVTKEQETTCAAEANAAAKTNPAGVTVTQMINACRNSHLSDCKAKCTGYDSKKEIKAACTEALNKWTEAAQKSGNACDEYEAVERGKENTCENRIAQCEKKIGEVSRLFTSSSSTTPGGLDPSGGSVDVLLQFYGQRNGIDPKQFRRDGNLINTTSCIKWSNDKVDEKKEKQDSKLDRIDEKIKTAKQKIADLEKEIAKENESLRKETATLDEEKEKIQTTFKENVAKIDVKKREKYTALNKSIQENLVKIRNLNNVIIKRKEDAERLKFDYAQRMVAFSEEKVSIQCKSAVDTARGCFAKAAKGEKFTEKDTCNGFTISGRGVTGTRYLVERLTQVRQACFEQANLAQDKARYDHQTQLKNIEQEIMEKQNQVKDLNKNAELEKQEFDAITKENETEKATETESSNQKQANLADKLNKLQASTKEKIDAANKQIKELNLEIEELVARKMPSALGIIPDTNGADVQVSHREAKKAIGATETARATAYSKCDCEEVLRTKKTDPNCTKLKSSATSTVGGGRGELRTRRSR